MHIDHSIVLDNVSLGHGNSLIVYINESLGHGNGLHIYDNVSIFYYNVELGGINV